MDAACLIGWRRVIGSPYRRTSQSDNSCASLLLIKSCLASRLRTYRKRSSGIYAALEGFRAVGAQLFLFH
jgi:hypothetical protein